MTHYWFWKKKLGERNRQPCRVLARGKMNSILVEFEDGYRVDYEPVRCTATGGRIYPKGGLNV